MVGNSDPITAPGGPPNRDDGVLAGIVSAFAQVQQTDEDDIWDRLRQEGLGLVVDSKEAEVIVSIIEEQVGRDLVRVEDLEPEKLTTVSALRELLGTAIEKQEK